MPWVRRSSKDWSRHIGVSGYPESIFRVEWKTASVYAQSWATMEEIPHRVVSAGNELFYVEKYVAKPSVQDDNRSEDEFVEMYFNEEDPRYDGSPLDVFEFCHSEEEGWPYDYLEDHEVNSSNLDTVDWEEVSDWEEVKERDKIFR